MEYSYDSKGWLSDILIPDRITEIAPPEHGEKIVGEPYPNWVGIPGNEWWMLTYGEPIPPSPPPTPEPVLKSILTPLEFLNRFTDNEAKSIITLSKTSADVELWWIKYNKAQDIDLDDPQTIEGVTSLETAGVLSPGRAAEILTKYPI